MKGTFLEVELTRSQPLLQVLQLLGGHTHHRGLRLNTGETQLFFSSEAALSSSLGSLYPPCAERVFIEDKLTQVLMYLGTQCIGVATLWQTEDNLKYCFSVATHLVS